MSNVHFIIYAAPTCTITGFVYRDYDYDGVRDNSYVSVTTPSTESRFLEPAVTGLTVTAYDSDGNAFTAIIDNSPEDATTGTYGQYTIAGLEDTESFRVEFTGISGLDSSGAVGANAPVGGTNPSGTSVQFVDCVPNATITGVDFSVSNPAHFCQRNGTDFSGNTGLNVEYVTTCYAVGDQTENIPTLVRGSYDASAHTGIADDFDTGTVMAISYHRETERAFASAFQRRTAGFRCNDVNGTPGNPSATCNSVAADSSEEAGVIYLFDPSTPGAVSEFIDFNAFPSITVDGVHTGSDGPTSGSLSPYVFEILPADTDFDDVWNAVGRYSFGDLDIFEDFTGMATERIYAVVLDGAGSIVDIPFTTTTGVPVATAGSVNQMSLANPSCNGDLRPGALKVFNGFVYYGLTCTGPSVSDLAGYVYRFVVGGSASSATQVASFALDYERQNASSRICDGDNRDETGATLDVDNTTNWKPWASTRTLIVSDTNDCLGGDFNQAIYPQPWLMDVEFDEYGFMLVGIADRGGLQEGSVTAGTGAPVNGTSAGVVAGDTLLLSPNDDQNPTAWILESDGVVGSGGLQRETSRIQTQNTDTDSHTTGPGGREFFTGERYQPNDSTPDHGETSLGNLGYLLGTGEVLTSSMDPDAYSSGGLNWLNGHTGLQVRTRRLYSGGTAGTFAKAAGIGDIEFLCAIPPLEIGNRVWLDPDEDGVQDPDETPIDGVTVNLYFDGDGDGEPDDPNTPVATTITANGGQYYFVENGNDNGGPGTAALTNTTAPGNNGGLFVYGENYVIRLDNPDDYDDAGSPIFSTLTGEAYFITAANSDDDIRDSDGIETDNGTLIFPSVSFNIGYPGQNNHTYDFGFSDDEPDSNNPDDPDDPEPESTPSTPVDTSNVLTEEEINLVITELPATGQKSSTEQFRIIIQWIGGILALFTMGIWAMKLRYR